MHKLLLCVLALVALATADVRPSGSQSRIQVQRQEDVFVTDMDRMAYDGLFTIEQTAPEELTSDIAIDDVMMIMENAIGPDWRDYVDVDDSAPISYLELIRLSSSVSMLNRNLNKMDDAKATRQDEEDEEEEEHGGHGSTGKKTNFCMCHGTGSQWPVNTIGGHPRHPYKGVRISGRGNGHLFGATGHNSEAKSAPYRTPRDCLLCMGLTNCNACCNGPCTAGDTDTYDAAVLAGPLDTTYWSPTGLYKCPMGQYFLDDPDMTDVNDVSGCNVYIDSCESAVELCRCDQRRHLLYTLGCTCSDVLVFCEDCYDAWDAIDRYKHCDCEDYALHYANGGPGIN